MLDRRQKNDRWKLVAQAALVWADGKFDTEGFIESGTTGGASDAIPFDPDLRDQIVAKFESGG